MKEFSLEFSLSEAVRHQLPTITEMHQFSDVVEEIINAARGYLGVVVVVRGVRIAVIPIRADAFKVTFNLPNSTEEIEATWDGTTILGPRHWLIPQLIKQLRGADSP